MGEWYETCGVTNLPIIPGDPVAFLLLTNVDRFENGSGYSYANEVWSPARLPIFGHYDGVGSIKRWEEDWNTEFTIETLNHQSSRIQVIGVEDLLKKLREEDIRVTAPLTQSNYHRIGFMMIHRRVYDQLSSIYADELIANFNKEYSLAIEKHAGAMWVLRIQEQFNHIDDPCSCWGFKDYSLLFEGHFVQNHPCDHPEVAAIIERLMRFASFHKCFTLLRRIYTPQSGKGSCNESYDMHRMVMAAAEQIIQERERET